jgi:hypothetical protein
MLRFRGASGRAYLLETAVRRAAATTPRKPQCAD